jgi:hypothetical protein
VKNPKTPRFLRGFFVHAPRQNCRSAEPSKVKDVAIPHEKNSKKFKKLDFGKEDVYNKEARKHFPRAILDAHSSRREK